jgi:hypothetical protein
MADKKAEPEFEPEYVRDISEAVYRERLGESDVASMIKNDKDDGKKLRGRSASYDGMTRSYLRAINHTTNGGQ